MSRTIIDPIAEALNLSPFECDFDAINYIPFGSVDPWNKGKINVYSEDTLNHMSESAKGNTKRRGSKMSIESRQKMRDAKLKNPVRYWANKTIPDEARAKMSESAKNRKPKLV